MPSTATSAAMPMATPRADSSARVRRCAARGADRTRRLAAARMPRHGPGGPDGTGGGGHARLPPLGTTRPSRSSIRRGADRGDRRIVGDDDQGHALVWFRCRSRATISARWPGPGCRSARRRARRPGPRPGPWRWRPAAARRRIARAAGAAAGGRGPPGPAGRGGLAPPAQAGTPRYSSPVATFSSAVSVSSRKNCWNITPTRRAQSGQLSVGQRATSWPAIRRCRRSAAPGRRPGAAGWSCPSRTGRRWRPARPADLQRYPANRLHRGRAG